MGRGGRGAGGGGGGGGRMGGMGRRRGRKCRLRVVELGGGEVMFRVWAGHFVHIDVPRWYMSATYTDSVYVKTSVSVCDSVQADVCTGIRLRLLGAMAALPHGAARSVASDGAASCP
jgi:hypothetical protein